MLSNKSTFTRLLVVGGLAITLPLAAQARPFGGDHFGPGAHAEMGMRGGHGMNRMLRGLDLTEAQRDQIFQLRHAQAPALREKSKELRDIRKELQEATMSEQYDEARVRALSDNAARAMAELIEMRARLQNQIYQLLTPEQRTKLEERKARFSERRGPGRS